MRQWLIVLVLAALLAGAAYYFVPAQLAGSDADKAATPAPVAVASPPAKPQVTGHVNASTSTELTRGEIAQVLQYLDADRKQAVLGDAEAFAQLVKREAVRRSLIQAARVAGLDRHTDVAYLMQRQADDYLMNTFVLRKLQAAGVPEGFPGPEQISAYYEQNRARFMTPEQLPVWQIFFQYADGADDGAKKALLARAQKIASQLQQGRLGFAAAAEQYSEHQASRANGGYMGLLKVRELIPAIKEPLLALEVGKISGPVTADNGIHIFRRGELTPAHEIPLAQAEPQIQKLLLEAYRQRQRLALIEQAQQQFPSEIPTAEMEKWRAGLGAAGGDAEMRK